MYDIYSSMRCIILTCMCVMEFTGILICDYNYFALLIKKDIENNLK